MTEVRFGRLIETDTWNAADMAKKAILFEPNDIGKVKLYSNEKLLHYLVKAILVYYLKRMGHRCVCEAKIAGCAQIDVFDIDTNTMYEVESERSLANIMRKKKKYLQAGVDLVIIQLPIHTMDFGEIADYVKMYIRPD